MRRHLLQILLCLGTLVCARQVSARPGDLAPHIAAGIAGSDTNIVYQIHQTPYFRSTATNFGYFGTVRERLRDPATGDLIPVMEAPPRSKIEYLYDAALWIGGIVGQDTLVSTGSLGTPVTHELYADAPQPGTYSDYYGDEEWTFQYGDTTTDPETVRDDAYDGPHRPLPVIVRQKTYTFDAKYYSVFLFIDVTIINVGNRPINGLWVGWMIDPDIGNPEEFIDATDDMTGHSTRSVATATGPVDVSVAWASDNDGDPDSNGAFTGRSPRGVFGSMYLGGTPHLEKESYNWWLPANTQRFDWGPQRVPGDTNLLGGRGRPLGDAFRYRLMSNREIDYPQVYAAVDRTKEGWIKPPRNRLSCDSVLCDSVVCDSSECFALARDLADGFDVRFLHSVGSATLAPGDSLTLTWVWTVSPNAHRSPGHFRRTFDPTKPNAYLDGVDIRSLELRLASAKQAWESAFSRVPIAPPRNFRLAEWEDTSATLAWDSKRTLRLEGYQITRSTSPRSNYAREIFWVPREATSFYDSFVNAVPKHHYRIACIGNAWQSGGLVGTASGQVTFLPGRARTPRPPLIQRGDHALIIAPDTAAESDAISYRVFRRRPDGGWAMLALLEPNSSYTDADIQTAVPYQYRVTAISHRGRESEPSPEVTGVWLALDGPVQIVDYTPYYVTALTDKDSVAAAWSRLIDGGLYRDASRNVTAYTLTDFNPHPVTIIVSDGRSPLPTADFPVFELYSNAQGVTIISGRDLFNSEVVLDATVELESGSIGYKAGIRRAYYPRTLLAGPTRMNAEFVAAAPVDPTLKRLEVDSTKTGWGLNPALPHPGNAIPFVGYFEIDTSAADVLYTFVSRDGAASPLHGKPVAVMSKDPMRTLAVFSFPLSYMQENDARECLTALLDQMGYPDGSRVDVTDLLLGIEYLYRNGSRPSVDVDGNEVIDVLDLVRMIDHVYRGVALPDVERPR